MKVVLLANGDLDGSDVECDEVVMDLICQVEAREEMRNCALRLSPTILGTRRVASGSILLFWTEFG